LILQATHAARDSILGQTAAQSKNPLLWIKTADGAKSGSVPSKTATLSAIISLASGSKITAEFAQELHGFSL
jgi:hypothetical protein